LRKFVETRGKCSLTKEIAELRSLNPSVWEISSEVSPVNGRRLGSIAPVIRSSIGCSEGVCASRD
jgi:hypothetical protein